MTYIAAADNARWRPQDAAPEYNAAWPVPDAGILAMLSDGFQPEIPVDSNATQIQRRGEVDIKRKN